MTTTSTTGTVVDRLGEVVAYPLLAEMGAARR